MAYGSFYTVWNKTYCIVLVLHSILCRMDNRLYTVYCMASCILCIV